MPLCKKPDKKSAGSSSSAKSPTSDCPLKKVLTVEWTESERWCSEKTKVKGTTTNYAESENLQVLIKDKESGNTVHSEMVSVKGQAFEKEWHMIDIIPPVKAGHSVEELEINAHATDKISPAALKIKFVPNTDKKKYENGRAHFELETKDFVAEIGSKIKYVKGWGASVVKLGASVPSGTGGLLDGKLTWSGYRWMKIVGVTKKFWDGSAWKSLPATFSIADSNNFCVGFYKSGSKYVCQYGGEWPENFTDWDVNATTKQAIITKWTDNIKTTWSGKFDLKRKECESSDTKCCRYKINAAVEFKLETTFASGMLIIADGNIRSNDSLFFLGEPRTAVAAHEFGHHMDNKDEYAGAVIDASLNEDGAVNGIDANSIMGQNLTTVKKRHYRAVAKHFAKCIKDKSGKTWNYDIVDKA